MTPRPATGNAGDSNRSNPGDLVDASRRASSCAVGCGDVPREVLQLHGVGRRISPVDSSVDARPILACHRDRWRRCVAELATLKEAPAAASTATLMNRTFLSADLSD